MFAPLLNDEEIERLIERGERLYAPVEIAHILQVRQTTVQEYFRSEKIRGVKINGMWYTTKEEIRRYVKEGPYKPPEEGNDNRQSS